MIATAVTTLLGEIEEAGVISGPGAAAEQIAGWLHRYDSSDGHGHDERQLRGLYYGALVYWNQCVERQRT